MMNPRWKDEAWYPGKKQIYKKIQQSTMESWLNKTQVMTMRTQTLETKTIRPTQCRKIAIPRQKLQAQWKLRSNAMKGNAQPQREEEQTRGTEYTKMPKGQILRN